jgi:hypothetical protein
MAEKMRVGWLWFDNDSGRTVEEKVCLAAERYQEKFGQKPNTCYVNPQAISGEKKSLTCPIGDGTVQVLTARHILPHHFWLGIVAVQKDAPRARAAA